MTYIEFKYEVILDPDYIKRAINILNENEYINKISFPLLWLDIDNKVYSYSCSNILSTFLSLTFIFLSF